MAYLKSMQQGRDDINVKVNKYTKPIPAFFTLEWFTVAVYHPCLQERMMTSFLIVEGGGRVYNFVFWRW